MGIRGGTGMKKIGELNTIHGTFEIKYDEQARYNPYKLYAKWYDGGWHRRLLANFCHLHGCISIINDFVRDHDETSRNF